MKLRFGILAILFAAAPAWAQTAAPQSSPAGTPQARTAPATASNPAAAVQKIDPAKESDIRRLLDVMGSKQAALEARDSMAEALRSSFTQSLPADDTTKKFIAFFVEKFRAKLRADDLLNLSIPVYDKYMSDEDIQGLIQFYQSPLGQRMLKIMPQVSEEVRKVGYDRGQKMAEESLNEVLAEHPELKQPPAPSAPPKQ